MAPVKKTAAKTAKSKTTAKKTAAKKTTGKKPAAKKTTAKTTAKKTTAKKTTAKATVKKAAAKTTVAKATAKKTAVKPAAKTTAARAAAKKTAAKATAKKAAAKTTAKTTAAKTTAKKAAAKTTAKKTTAKTTAKKAETKVTAVRKTAVKKTVEPVVEVIEQASVAADENQSASVKETAESGEVLDPNVKSRNLFDAFTQGKLPFANGYIVSSFFSETSAYSIYEVVSYAGVKEIFPTDTGLQFTTGGKKLYILVEPDTYQSKFQEPVSRSRSQGEHIPKRFSELEIIIAKNQTKIMISKEPDETFGSFTILRPQGQNFAVVFYQLPDVYASLAAFFEESLNRQRRVPQADAKKAAKKIAEIVEKYMSSKGEFE